MKATNKNLPPPVWERAQGKWEGIYSALAGVDLADAMRARPKTHTACPVHGGRNGDAFRLMADWRESGAMVCNTCGRFPNGIVALAWLKGWTNQQAAAAVDEVLEGGNVTYAPVVERQHSSAEDADKQAGKDEFAMRCLLEAWEGAVPLGHDAAEPVLRYFDRRGLTPMEGPLADLRCHPALGYWEGGKRVGTYPALVALVRQPSGEVATIHRTYLTGDGHKAPVAASAVKKLMPRPSFAPITGAAVRLDEGSGRILHTAEGIETALAVRNITGEATWSGISSTLLPSIEPLPGVESIVIWCDRDPDCQGTDGRIIQGAGRHAAERAVARLEARGLRAMAMLPPALKHPSETVDWNDVVQRFEPQAIRKWPSYHQLRQWLEGARSAR